MRKNAIKAIVIDNTILIEEWARLGYEAQEIAKDLGIARVTLRKHDGGAYKRGHAAYKADCIAEIDMKKVEQLTKERYNITEVMNELDVQLSEKVFGIVARKALDSGRAARPAKFGVVEQVPVHQPRFVPYNGKPCPNGHRARRIINMGGYCAECHRLRNTVGKKLQDFIGQPRKRGATYKSTPCPTCRATERYESTNRCVNCTRHYAFNYSRMIGLGTLIATRKTK
jgi:hypothetical protein